MSYPSIIKKATIEGREYTFEFNKFAKLTNGSVLVSCGNSQVLVTACAAAEQKEQPDFFPLTVNYIEKFYAAGRIPGGFFKRESKPSDTETLIARCIDRPLRPSFPENFLCETQIVATVLSHDDSVYPGTLAMMGASFALMISDIPFNGPLAALRVGMKEDGSFMIDPTEEEDLKRLDLVVAAKPGAVLMVEAGADFLTEAQMMDAITFAHTTMQPLFDLQLEIQKEIGKPKRAVPKLEIPADIREKVLSFAADKIDAVVTTKVKVERSKAMSDLKKAMLASVNPEGDSKVKFLANQAFGDLVYNHVRGMISKSDKRIDGRALDEVRPIFCETRLIKSTHGSALFQRGETQALAITTLGSGDDAQRLDSLTTQNQEKKFMLHYNFPPFSVGEARMMRPPGRREIGHGALAEKALSQVMPSNSEFGYTVRLVSEVLESNGSSSMATVCGGTMSLLDAGVPLKEPVAGIAMGLIKEDGKYKVLSDILGDEDHLGDMDFKVCGGSNGITALQMDIKIDGLPREVLGAALDQARAGRLHILEKMNAAISKPNELSDTAPRIFKIKVDAPKIKDVIGPGGKNIKRIVSECGVKVDIGDNGIIDIVSPNIQCAEAAKTMIRDLVTDPEVGKVYLGKVVKIMDFGAFVEIKPGVEGLVHISQLDHQRVEKVEDFVKEGEEIMVKLLEIDRMGRLKLSRKEATV